MPGLGLEISLRLDAFSLLMVTLVSGIGVLVFAYATWYFGTPKPRLGYFAGVLTAFAGAMLGLVLAGDVFTLFLFWELTSITSFLLIGFEDEHAASRAAAVRALLTTTVGALALLAGLVLLAQAAGTSSIAAILADPPSGGTVPVALVLVLLGAGTKSALVPFHYWLPGAMAAPTPVSAYLHSATMVKAGVYLIARFAPSFADVGVWRPLVLTAGLATMLLGGWVALSRFDLKALLAYGTISQLGFLVVLLGAGDPVLTTAGCAVLLAHGLFKAALFMVAGIVEHQAHTRDIRALSGLGRRMPVVAAIAVVAAASMAGIAPMLGFLAKEKAYDALLDADLGVAVAVLAGVVASSVLTVAYSVRFVRGTFGTEPAPVPDAAATTAVVGSDVPRAAWPFVVPAGVLAALTLAAGLAPGLVNPLVQEAAAALDPSAGTKGLVLWPGFSTALALSAITVVLGIAVATAGGVIERFATRWTRLPSGEGTYAATVAGVLDVARRTALATQTGSLPVYLTLVLVTVLVLPGLALLRHTTWPVGATFAESPMQAAVAAFVAVAAIATTMARRRFVAVVALGAVGYGVAVLFVVQGAPDLALVQVLVETLTVAVFVFVLRYLPLRFPERPGTTLRRAALSGLVGLFAAGFLLVASSARVAEPVADAYLEQAYPDAGGRNVVNVILVDFRSLDTLGEITVLAVAGIGITSLVLARRTARREPDDAPPARTGAGPDGPEPAA